MEAVLQIAEGPLAGHVVQVRSGLTIQVGRTQWADVAIDSDPEMADVHFSVACDADACTLTDLSEGKQTLVNDEQVTQQALQHGDRITAGGTAFNVMLAGVPQQEEAGDGAEAEPPPEPSGFEKVPPAPPHTLVRLDDLDEAAAALVVEHSTARACYDALLAAGLVSDAVSFLAGALPKREAVWWATECAHELGDASAPADAAALEAARAWAADPTEESRRAAEAAAEATGMATVAGFIAQAAFWNSGSMSAPDLPEAPAPDHLTAVTLAGALSQLHGEAEPAEAEACMRAILDKGVAVADGMVSWEA